MKKTILITAFTLLIGSIYGQTMKKGALLGAHAMTVELKPNVTMDQFATFYRTKLIPAYEKEFQGAKGFIATGVRGEHANQIALIWLFDTESARNRYFNPDGTPSELGKAALERLSAFDKEVEKLGTSTTAYTDWLIQ